MPTQPYKNAAGKRLPSVTTVLNNLGWNKDALTAWAYQKGLNGEDRFKTTQDACDVGTMAHAMAEADIKGEPMPDYPEASLENREKAAAAFNAYLSWKRMTRVELVMSEIPLISERHQFGGCIDAIGVIDGETCLIDFKTSNGTYPDHLIQIAAYRELWNENHPDTPVQHCHLLRFGKEEGDFHHGYYPNLDKQWRAFQLLLELHNMKKSIGRAA
jgi:hypothetical protein